MAKYDSVTKTKRNLQLIDYANKNSELSLAEIGEVFRISRQRVQQILDKYKKKGGSTTEQSAGGGIGRR